MLHARRTTLEAKVALSANRWRTETPRGLGVALLAFSLSIGCRENPPVMPDDAATVTAANTEEQPSTTTTVPQIEPGAITDEGLIILDTDVPEPPVAANVPAEPPVVADNLQPEPLDAIATSIKRSSESSTQGNVASEAERNQKIAEDWPEPQAVLFVSGQQHGYLEPCGCTGLENQKGGLIRRDTLLSSLRDRGWELVPLDVGNQVRRLGRQPEIKFQTTVKALETMDYAAVAFGVDDLKLSSVELVNAAAAGDPSEGMFVATNVSVLDPSFFADTKIVEVGGRKIGITAILGSELKENIKSDDIEVSDPVEKLAPAVEKLLAEKCDFIALLAHASMEESAAIAKAVPGIDVVVTAGGHGEPTLEPEPIEGSDAVMIQVGTKGMYGGIIGLFDDPKQPMRYQKIAISSQFKDSPRMLADFAEYQKRLETAGFEGNEGLGVLPVSHPTGRKFVGSESCGDCHTTAYEIWKSSPHFHATESIVNPPNDRGGIQRHFDPECISCHVTGWNPQEFYPYESGYASLEASQHLLGSGCENCHGPGSQHVAAENGDIDADNELLEKLREQMVLPLEHARDRCIQCHDLDNSIEFHEEGAFEKYWEQVKHYGKD